MYFPGLQEDNFLNKTLALYAVFALIFYPFVLSAQEATSTQESYPIIETEDTIATADIENEVNTNDIQISGDIDTQNNATSTQSEENTKEQVLVEEKSEPATTTKPLLVQEENADNTQATSTQATSTPISVDVKTESKAVVENDINTQASTGENEIIGDGGVIVTGDSYAGANVANVVNTNIYNSYGFLYLLNQFFGRFQLLIVFSMFVRRRMFGTAYSFIGNGFFNEHGGYFQHSACQVQHRRKY
jgi:hypothetical protein